MKGSRSISEDNIGHGTVKPGSDRSFGLVFAVVFAVLGTWPLLRGEALRPWAVLIASGFLVVALARPAWLHRLNLLWFRLGLLLHRIVNPLVMGILYFAVMTPTALLMRLLGKDPLRLRRDPIASSYWIPRDPPGPDPDSMRHQF